MAKIPLTTNEAKLITDLLKIKEAAWKEAWCTSLDPDDARGADQCRHLRHLIEYYMSVPQ